MLGGLEGRGEGRGGLGCRGEGRGGFGSGGEWVKGIRVKGVNRELGTGGELEGFGRQEIKRWEKKSGLGVREY